MADVFANSRSILHQGDGNQHVAAPPDVCKTPTPGGPVPLPYVNMAMSSALAKGTKKVKINGKSVATEAANLSTSTGDEPGTAGGGIISSKFKGKMTWGSSSTDVKFEGKGVARFADVTQHNENTFNTAFISPGSPNTGVAYADDFDHPCEICKKGPKEHRIFETKTTADLCAKIIEGLEGKFDGLRNNPSTTKSQLSKLANERNDWVDGKKQGKKWNGYMVGVMTCKCHPGQSFAAMSGTTLSGFTEVASKIADHVIPGNSVTREEFVASNQSKLAGATKKKQRVQKAWRTVEDKMKTTPEGYNPPGSCAAMKLLARAGHAPLEMTEMFFDPNAGTSKAWTATYDWMKTESKTPVSEMSTKMKERILQNRRAKVKSSKVDASNTIPSCHTCQALLYMSNCPERVCPK